MSIKDYKTYRGRISFLPVDLNWKPKDKRIKVIKNTNNYKENEQLKKNLHFQFSTPLEEPVPNDWLTIEDDFSLFLISNLPFIGF
jgi:hypothetical protein